MRLRFLLALPVALVPAACGGTRAHSTTVAQRSAMAQPRFCSVHVYFAGRATHTEEQVVRANLGRDARVKRVVFTSKAQALAEFKKSHPQIYKALQGIKLGRNPLPDSFAVLPVSLADTRQIGTSIKRARWRGVANVIPARCKPKN